MKTKLFIFIVLLLCAIPNSAEIVLTDELTTSDFGFDQVSSGYVEKNYTSANSKVAYNAQANGGVSFIQIRSKSNNSGVVSTTSCGYVKSVRIIQNAEYEAQQIDIYASNTAFASPADLYAVNANKVGSTTTLDQTITFTSNYQYVGVRSSSGARYIDKIVVEWIKMESSSDDNDWKPDTLTVAEACAIISNNTQAADGSLLKDKPHYIKGVVSAQPNSAYWPGYAAFWLSDIDNPTILFEGYKIYKDANQTKWQSIADIPCSINDTILLYANSLTYYAKENVYETTSGYFVKIIGNAHVPSGNNVITYTASSELEVPGRFDYDRGFHSDAFNVYITSHKFDYATQTGTIIFDGDVTTIGKRAFYYCSKLISITIPSSVTTIGDEAFCACSGLTSITIPNSVTTIGQNAFRGCYRMTSINVDTANTHYKSENGILFNYTQDTLLQYPIGNIRDTYTIPNSVATIGNAAFYNCDNLTSVTISNSVTTIGDEAFDNCDILTSVTIGNSVTTIGDEAFYNCYGLKTVYNLSNLNITKGSTDNGYVAYYADVVYDGVLVGDFVIKNDTIVTKYIGTATEIIIPNGITVIGGYAFFNRRDLTSITIPNSVTTIEGQAFYYCSSLLSPVYNSSIFAYMPPSYQGGYTIPNGIQQIVRLAFDGCSSLTSVTIPNSVTTIGSYAFHGCSGLTSVTIGNSVTMIENNAFYFCDNLSSVTIEATTPPSIGSWVWDHNDGSYCVFYIPCGTKTAYQEAWGYKTFIEPSFDYALTLKESEYGIVQNTVPLTCANNVAVLLAQPQAGYHFTQWNDSNTDNPRSVVITQDTTIEAFFAMDYSGQCGDNLYWQYNNDTLSITGSGVMYDGQPWYLFVDSITEVSLPSELTTIGASAFANIAKLNSITIPTLVTAIGDYAFDGCRKLFDIYCLAIEPPVAQTSSFTNYNVYLHVPCNILRDYQMDAVFGSFKYIECMGAEETFIEGDQVIVITSTDNVTLTWPADDQAAGYSIEITKDGVVFCTLKFNAQGQLIGIAFAPGRDGAPRMSQAAVLTANGWQFTVTGLNQATRYAYTIDVLDAQQQSIKHYQGEFQTDGATDIEETLSSSTKEASKFFRDGILYILRDGKTYDAQGMLMK